MPFSVSDLFEYIVLAIGVLYAVILLKKGIIKGKIQGEGTFWKIALGEGLVYFFAAMGFSDFLLNIPLFNKTKWVSEEQVPQTLMASVVVPGSAIAFYYLNSSEVVDLRTILPCIAAVALGSYLGSHLLVNIDGKIIRRIMMVALIFSMAALIFRLIVSNGVSGTATTLSFGKICIAVPVIFLLAFINPFGVPMKPPCTALFLLLGLSPVTTLTIMLVLCAVSPAAACVSIIKSGNYQKKVSVAGVTAGVVGALLGCLLAISLDQLVLTIILLVIILITIFSLRKKSK